MMRRFVTIVLLAVALGSSGCAGTGPSFPTGPTISRNTQTGLASYYGPQFHGRTTASGTIYRRNDLTAAHRTLPFGTRVRVTNLQNGRDVVVTITDRGPHRRGRIIDLSKRAARELDFLRAGTARVRLQILD